MKPLKPSKPSLRGRLASLLTIQDFETITGIPPKTQTTLRLRRQVPFVKLSGRIVRYDPVAIAGWIKRNTIAAKQRRTVPVRRRAA